MRFNPTALREARNKAGLSLEALAEKSGVGFNTIWYLEKGRSLGPRANTVSKLAAALEVEWSIFFAQENQKTDEAAVAPATPAA